MFYIKITCCAFCVLLFLGCAKEELSPVEYVKWVEDESNGLRKSKIIHDLEFQVQYKTDNYILMKEANINPVDRKEDFENEKKKLGEMQYFTFKIKTPDGTDPLRYKIPDKEEYFARVKYYSFDMQQDLQLVDGNDTLQCQLAHFERSFGLTPEIICLLAFPPSNNKELIEDKEFIYYDRVFNSGHLIFSFSKQDINRIPKIKS